MIRLFKRKKRKSWLFEPKDDITAWETAMCLKVSFCPVSLGDELFSSLPDSVTRHWRVVEE